MIGARFAGNGYNTYVLILIIIIIWYFFFFIFKYAIALLNFRTRRWCY
jgi:hypothetical protein